MRSIAYGMTYESHKSLIEPASNLRSYVSRIAEPQEATEVGGATQSEIGVPWAFLMVHRGSIMTISDFPSLLNTPPQFVLLL